MRPSGRTDGQIRSLLCERSVISRADGSARWCQDQTSVIAAVYGPRAAGAKNEDPSKATLDVIFRPVSGIGGSREADYERIISETFASVVMTSLHPRAEVQIVVQVAAEDGSVLPCAINAVTVALVDAGVPMKRMVAALNVAYKGGNVSLDPDRTEERAAEATCLVSVPSSTLRSEEHQGMDANDSTAGVLSCVVEGAVAVEAWERSMDLAKKGCAKLLKFMNGSLGKGLRKQVPEGPAAAQNNAGDEDMDD